MSKNNSMFNEILPRDELKLFGYPRGFSPTTVVKTWNNAVRHGDNVPPLRLGHLARWSENELLAMDGIGTKVVEFLRAYLSHKKTEMGAAKDWVAPQKD